MEQAKLLVGEAHAEASQSSVQEMRRAGHAVVVAPTRGELAERLATDGADLVLEALDLGPDETLELLRELKGIRPSVPVVIHAAHPTVEMVVGAFRNGAFDVVCRSGQPVELCERVARAIDICRRGEKRRLLAEQLESERQRVRELESQLTPAEPFRRMIGHSPVVQRLVDTVREVARTDSTVLLTGESGTGKGLVARTIHEASARARGPFVEANCVVYSEGTLQSELFGHEKGAFTGASRRKKGRFELAAGGSLFLDEIGEIPHPTQLSLLRVLQDRTFERVGGEETLEADVRLIAATNRDLQEAVAAGGFRADLYYRLNVIPVRMPALRERADDVPLLAQFFLARCTERFERQIQGFTPEAIEALMQHPWPGNVRELENVIERVVVLNRSGIVELEDLPKHLRPEGSDRPAAVANGGAAGTLRSLERSRIAEVLRQCDGNKKLAARRLGIHRSTLYAKLERYGLAGPSEEAESPAAAGKG